MPSSLAGADLLSIQDLDKQEILLVLEQADRLQDPRFHQSAADLLAGRALAPLFYEPAMWLRASFERAMGRLGGQVLSMTDLPDGSLVQESEALALSARSASAFADLIVHRHPKIYSAHEAAKGARVPLINAGDGTYEHPTQGLVDLYTIRREKGTIDGLSIALVGDLRHSPVVHSLTRALAHWDVTLYLVSPPDLKMAAVLTIPLKRRLTVVETEDLDAAMDVSDVLYVAPGQQTAMVQGSSGEDMRARYRIDQARLRRFEADLTVMHPLPLGDGIVPDVRLGAEAAYFRQAENGIWVRMAVLALLLDVL